MLDQEKIGRFIAERRKAQELTQKQLADKLGVSDKAVSKWETGRSMPDNAILFELCEVLETNVNELLSGEKLSADSYHGKAEENMMKLMQEKQKNGHLSAIVGLGFFFGKKKEMDGEMLCRTKAAYKLVLIALPVAGTVMTLIAVVAVVGLLSDVNALGPNLAVAILTLLYSLVLEVLLLPVAGRLWTIKGE